MRQSVKLDGGRNLDASGLMLIKGAAKRKADPRMNQLLEEVAEIERDRKNGNDDGKPKKGKGKGKGKGKRARGKGKVKADELPQDVEVPPKELPPADGLPATEAPAPVPVKARRARKQEVESDASKPRKKPKTARAVPEESEGTPGLSEGTETTPKDLGMFWIYWPSS